MSTNVAKCIQMYTYVAPISVFWDAILRLTEQILAVPDGYREDVLGAFHSVSADRILLQVFFGREQWLFSSCASNVHNVGPHCGRTRGTFSIQAAFRGLVRIRCNFPGSGRPKSTQVDVSRRKSTGFLFFWAFFLISQTFPPADSGTLTMFVSIRCLFQFVVCSNSLQLPWDRAGFDGLCRRLSVCFTFFGPYMLEFADVSSPSSIGIGR